MIQIDSPAVRRRSQPLALRPSLRADFPATAPQGRPDELMIDWGDRPPGGFATLYWPSVPAVDVVRMAGLLYAAPGVEVADAHTVRMAMTGRLTFLPIPFAADRMLAGLLTLEPLEHAARRSAGTTLVVRRLSTRRAGKTDPVQGQTPGRGSGLGRYVVGTFEISLPAPPAAQVLWREEDALAILRYRLGRIPSGGRWRAVMERFVADTAARVDALGGKAASIRASPAGAHPPHPGPGRGGGEHRHTGKVREVVFDGFGALEGFVLETATGDHRFAAHDPAVADLILRLCRDDLRLTVVTEGEPPRIRTLIVGP